MITSTDKVVFGVGDAVIYIAVDIVGEEADGLHVGEAPRGPRQQGTLGLVEECSC